MDTLRTRSCSKIVADGNALENMEVSYESIADRK